MQEVVVRAVISAVKNAMNASAKAFHNFGGIILITDIYNPPYV